MNKILIVIVAALMIFSCNNNEKNATQNVSKSDSAVSQVKVIKIKTDSIETHVIVDTNMPKYTSQQKADSLSDYDYTAPYICPNHCPGSGSDKPGKCPVCGMDLIPNPDYQKTKTQN